MPKILLLGSDGLLGGALKKEFLSFPSFYFFNKKGLDITDFKKSADTIKKIAPGIIINAAAYSKVDAAESSRELAYVTNGYAVGNLAKIANSLGSILVHFSTDYVFRGEKEEGYTERDLPEKPVNAYGESKLLGEKLLEKNHDSFYVVRLSGLFGEGGRNFVDTILTIAEERETLKIVDDQQLKLTYSCDLSVKVKELLLAQPGIRFCHFTNEGLASWCEFAKSVFTIRENLTGKASPEIIPCLSEDLRLSARRPRCSALLNTEFPALRHWQSALEEYLTEKKERGVL